jgi:hypothetical protein
MGVVVLPSLAIFFHPLSDNVFFYEKPTKGHPGS